MNESVYNKKLFYDSITKGNIKHHLAQFKTMDFVKYFHFILYSNYIYIKLLYILAVLGIFIVVIINKQFLRTIKLF